MQNLEWYLADLTSTGKNTIETVEKSLTDIFIRLVRIYPCLYCLYREIILWRQIRLSQATDANGFVTMSLITIMVVAPLSSDHRGFRRYRSKKKVYL